MLERILISLLTQLVSWFYNKALTQKKEHDEIKKENQSIDQKKEKLKEVVSEMFDGQPVTKEQKEKFQKAVSDFIKSNNNNGGL